MPDLSEFVGFVTDRSGIAKPALVEQDILIHGLLKRLVDSPEFTGKYVFKGGSCLVKIRLHRHITDTDAPRLR